MSLVVSRISRRSLNGQGSDLYSIQSPSYPGTVQSMRIGIRQFPLIVLEFQLYGTGMDRLGMEWNGWHGIGRERLGETGHPAVPSSLSAYQLGYTGCRDRTSGNRHGEVHSCHAV